MDGLLLDLKYAIRSIASAKKLAVVVVATLALGIGANTAVFGVLHAVVLKPLPYDEPDRLVRIYHDTGSSDEYLPGPELLGYRDGSRALDIAAVYTYSALGADLTDRAEPERVRTLSVSADYFRVLRVHPVLGQVFDLADERPDGHVAVVSERIWRKYLSGGADATGRPLTLDGILYRIAAVLPEAFDDPLESGIDRDFIARLGAVPGVRSAAAISRLPVTGSYHSWDAGRADRPPVRPRGAACRRSSA